MSDFRTALLINFASASSGAVVRLLVSILLARLLAPAEIGIYAITLVFVNLAQVFRELGVASYLQREAELTPAKIRAALGVLCAAGLLMGLLLLAGSWPLARYFDNPELRPVMQVLALGFVLTPFSAVTVALLHRELAAARIAYVARVGTAAYALSALGLAWQGFGAMSLAWAYLINIVACTLACLSVRPADMPWRPSLKQAKGVLHFGAGTVLSNALHALNNALPELLLGKLGSAHLVGLFHRAHGTVQLFGAIAGPASGFGALPRLARQHQEGQALAPLLNRWTALLTGLGWPVLALCALLGEELVQTLYGSAWLACVPAIPALALTVALGLLFNYSGAALAAVGRPALAAWPVAVTTASRLALAALYFDGSLARFSHLVLAAALPGLAVLAWLHRRHLGHSLHSLAGALAPSLLVTLLSASLVATLLQALPAGLSAPGRLLLALPAALLGWYAAIRTFNHPLTGEVHSLVGGLSTRLRMTIRK